MIRLITDINFFHNSVRFYSRMAEPLVSIKQGKLRGNIDKLYDGSSYYSFKGIPYAQPPIGKLRFKAPLLPKPWQGIYDATKHGPVCPQVEIFSKVENPDEDCLFLNVYTKSLQQSAKKAVMVFIHGGAFQTGSGNDPILGPKFLLQHDVVLVTLNYRLEVFGFLCLDTPEVPGNAGMKDQVLALRWVKENIAEFGGDPDNVTLFGESAGAVSVTHHMLSPMSKGLFHKAIAQSGVSLNDWAYGREAKERAFRAGALLGKETNDPKELLDFLQNIPAENIIKSKVTLKTATEDEKFRCIPMHFIPVIEKKFDGVEGFLTENPLDMILENKISKVPLVVGYTSNEGILMLPLKAKVLDLHNKCPEYFLLREIVQKTTLEHQKALGIKVKEFYFGYNDISFDEKEKSILSYLLSDTYFTYDIHRFTHLYSKISKPIYMYRFDLDTELNIFKNALQPTLKGASHADDILYLFSSVLNESIYEDNEKTKDLVYRVTKLWTNFAKTGNPTPDSSLGVQWVPYTSSKKEYLNISDPCTMGQYAEKDRIEFLNKIYQEAGLVHISKSNL